MTLDNDLVARLGGDEFAIITTQEACDGPVALIARIVTVIEQPIRMAGIEVSVSVSIGFACVDGTQSPEDVLREADLAMYETKNRRQQQEAIHG